MSTYIEDIANAVWTYNTRTLDVNNNTPASNGSYVDNIGNSIWRYKRRILDFDRYVSLKPRSFGIVGLPKRGVGPLTKPPPNAQIDWQHPLAQGLVGCWLLDGTLFAPAKSRGGHALGVGGLNSIYGKFSTGAAFNGSTAYYTIANPLAIEASSAFTLTTLFRTASSGSGADFRSLVGETSSAGNSLRLNYYNGEVVFRIGGSSIQLTSGSIFVGDGDYLLSVTRLTSSLLAYIDGKNATLGNPSSSSGFTPKYIGVADQSGLLRYWAGGIYAILQHSRQLNPNEIAQLHYSPYQFFWIPGARTIFLPIYPKVVRRKSAHGVSKMSNPVFKNLLTI